jgi:hypothetical protein
MGWKPPMPNINIFLVNQSGTLSLEGYRAPETRMDAYGISFSYFMTHSDLALEADTHQPVLWELQNLFTNWRDAEIEILSSNSSNQDSVEVFKTKWDEGFLDDADNATNWLEQLSKEQFSHVSEAMLTWGKGDPSCDDYDSFDEPMSGQDMAYQMFSEGCYADKARALGVEIVEGDHPGSSYIAAELSLPIAEANKKAEEAGFDIRFKNEAVLIYRNDNYTMLSSWIEELYCRAEEDGSLVLLEHKHGDGEEQWFDPIKEIRTVEDLTNAIEGLYNIDPPSIDHDFIAKLHTVNSDLARKLGDSK